MYIVLWPPPMILDFFKSQNSIFWLQNILNPRLRSKIFSSFKVRKCTNLHILTIYLKCADSRAKNIHFFGGDILSTKTIYMKYKITIKKWVNEIIRKHTCPLSSVKYKYICSVQWRAWLSLDPSSKYVRLKYEKIIIYYYIWKFEA